MNFTNFGFSFSIAAVGPVALKNQTRPSRRVQAAMVRVLSPAMSVVENVVSAGFQWSDLRSRLCLHQLARDPFVRANG